MGSRLQALHEKKEEVQRLKAAQKTELFQGEEDGSRRKVEKSRSSERKENQEALDETTRSVEQYVEQHKQNEEAAKNATCLRRNWKKRID